MRIDYLTVIERCPGLFRCSWAMSAIRTLLRSKRSSAWFGRLSPNGNPIVASCGRPLWGRERSFGRGDQGVDPRPALRARSWGRGEDRSDRIRGVDVVEGAHCAPGAIEQSMVIVGGLLF
jgi:hypothetical protein